MLAVHFEMGDYDHCIEDCQDAVTVGRDHRADFKSIAKLVVEFNYCVLVRWLSLYCFVKSFCQDRKCVFQAKTLGRCSQLL